MLANPLHSWTCLNRAGISLALALASAAVVPAHSAGSPPAGRIKRMFLEAPAPAAADPPKARSARRAGLEVQRSKPVQVALEEWSQLRSGDALEVGLFDGAEAVGRIDRREQRRPGDYTLFGRIEGAALSTLIAVVRDGVAAATLNIPGDGEYQLIMEPGGSYRFEQVAAFDGCQTEPGGHAAGAAHAGGTEHVGHGPEKGDAHEALDSSASGAAADRSSPAARSASAGGACWYDDGDEFDVLAVYTTAARDAAGGTSAILARIQLMVDRANQIYINSGVTTRMNVVHAVETTYNEDGSIFEHRTRLRDPSDGFMDFVHNDRDTYAADIVSLFFDQQNPTICSGGDNDQGDCTQDSDCPGGGTCVAEFAGLAYTMQEDDFDGWAFNVNEWHASTMILAHEIGHNQGCAHDRDNPQGGGYYSFSWGHRFTDGDPGVCSVYDDDGDAIACNGDGDCPDSSTCIRWRTIMAYAPGERIDWFSNPNVDYEGVATGVDQGESGEAYNALTINLNDRTVANFRASGRWVNFSYGGSEVGCFSEPFNTLAEGRDAVPARGTVWMVAGSTSETITINQEVTLRAVGGTVIIGAP